MELAACVDMNVRVRRRDLRVCKSQACLLKPLNARWNILYAREAGTAQVANEHLRPSTNDKKMHFIGSCSSCSKLYQAPGLRSAQTQGALS